MGTGSNPRFFSHTLTHLGLANMDVQDPVQQLCDDANEESIGTLFHAAVEDSSTHKALLLNEAIQKHACLNYAFRNYQEEYNRIRAAFESTRSRLSGMAIKISSTMQQLSRDRADTIFASLKEDHAPILDKARNNQQISETAAVFDTVTRELQLNIDVYEQRLIEVESDYLTELQLLSKKTTLSVSMMSAL